MNEISRNLTNCERHLKTATEAIAHGTMTPEQHEQARKAVILARGQLDEAYCWLYDNKPREEQIVPRASAIIGPSPERIREIQELADQMYEATKKAALFMNYGVGRGE